MKRKLLIFLINVLLSISGFSQITEAEYFIDTDPGVGLAESLSVSSGDIISENFTIPSSGLENGLHVLHIRVKGTDNVWSLYNRSYFYIQEITNPPVAKNITAAEYFIDDDPGVGSGSALSVSSGMSINETFTVPTNSLADGLHVLHIRVKDGDDQWSLFNREYFYLQTAYNFSTTPITAAEYFFDSDPGIGNGNDIAITEGYSIDEVFMIPVPMDMTNGEHYLYIRVKDQDGNWSLAEFAVFEVDDSLEVEEHFNENFKVFPNPTHALLNVNFKSLSDYEIKVIDVHGKQLQSLKTNRLQNKINFLNVSKGVYVLIIKDLTNQVVKKLKVIKT